MNKNIVLIALVFVGLLVSFYYAQKIYDSNISLKTEYCDAMKEIRSSDVKYKEFWQKNCLSDAGNMAVCNAYSYHLNRSKKASSFMSEHCRSKKQILMIDVGGSISVN